MPVRSKAKTAKKTHAKARAKVAKKIKTKVVKKLKVATAKARPSKVLGKVVHYYDRIGVAIIEVASPIKLGDTVRFQRGELDKTQRVTSLQVDHEAVKTAKKGQVVGVKVRCVTPDGTLVLAS